MGVANPNFNLAYSYIFMNNSIYYNYNKISTYRQPIKSIVGGEGIGKTYGLKYKLINEVCNLHDNNKDGYEICWFIRYDIDITTTYMEKWQDDLPIEYKQRLKLDGRTLYLDNEPFCYFLALSKFITGKGVPYPKVKHAIFDEFILDKDSRYLPNEIFAFKRWTQSIFRLRNVSWWLLANSLSFDNPYFNYFKVKKSPQSEWFSNEKIVIHFPSSKKEFLAKAKQSDYYNLFNDEETLRYGLEGEFYFDNEEFISSQPVNAKPLFNIKCQRYILSVWQSKSALWVSQKQVANQRTFALARSDTSTNTIYNPTLVKMLQDCYTNNLLWFDGLTIKNLLLENLKCL